MTPTGRPLVVHWVTTVGPRSFGRGLDWLHYGRGTCWPPLPLGCALLPCMRSGTGGQSSRGASVNAACRDMFTSILWGILCHGPIGHDSPLAQLNRRHLTPALSFPVLAISGSANKTLTRMIRCLDKGHWLIRMSHHSLDIGQVVSLVTVRESPWICEMQKTQTKSVPSLSPMQRRWFLTV